MELRSKRLLRFFLIEYIALSMIVAYRFIDLQSTLTLLIFSALFGSLIFQLNGTLNQKLSLLTKGNIIGVFCNFLFHYFSIAGYMVFEESFNPFYIIIYPLFNLMWVVPFWAFSLGILPTIPPASAEATLQ
jgi:hypothetical protein